MPARPIRVLCNARWFNGRSHGAVEIESIPMRGAGLLATLRLFIAARECDAVVLNIAQRQLLLFALLKRLVGMRRCRLVSVDIHLTSPRTARDRMRARLLGWLLREVDLFICYCKATERLQRTYGLERQRFAYVPFKVNSYEKVRAVEPTDEGFALVCGRSERDYATLAAAARGTDVPIVVLTGPDHFEHKVDVGPAAMPANVTVRLDDGSADTWIRWIARSRFIVLPVLPEAIKPSGISTYLEAMALGKCVIITDSPATQGLIDSGEAVLVPPGDAAALRDAIVRVAHDESFRNRVARAGEAYARSLGDESRLAQDIVECVVALVGTVAA